MIEYEEKKEFYNNNDTEYEIKTFEPKVNRDFKGVWISKEIWLATNITAIEKMLLAEIDSLDNSERGCFAGNAYFANFLNVSEKAISRYISNLKKEGYIKQIYFDGRERRLKRLTNNRLPITEEPDPPKVSSQTTQNCLGRLRKNGEYINTINNTINNNIAAKKSYAEFVSMTEKEYNALIDKYGISFTTKCIEELDNAKGAKGYKYKSDYRAILSWVVKKVQKENIAVIEEKIVYKQHKFKPEED